jgi:SAM-dependent methyltransferase
MTAAPGVTLRGAATGLLRLGRTAALRLAGPGDRLYRRLAGRPPLPPLWLRRHTGPLGSFESAARDTADLLARLDLPGAGQHVLDMGCGCGAMVTALLARVGPGGGYTGFDVHRPSIRWCRRQFAADPRCRFEVAELASPYGRRSGASVAAYRFPVADGEIDFVLAKSLFTHLLADDARHYLSEIRRALRPGGKGLLTAFLFAPPRPGAAEPPAFPHPAGAAASAVRWRSASRPQAAVAFERSFFEALLAEAHLDLLAMVPGYWPGDGATLLGQDTLVVAASTASTKTPKT